MQGRWLNISRDGHDAAKLEALTGEVIATVGERGQCWFWQTWNVYGVTFSIGIAESMEQGMLAAEAAWIVYIGG